TVPLVDVRTPDEIVVGVIPTSHHIPLAVLEEALVELPDETFEERYGFKRFGKDDEVIFYCRSGRRSNLAYEKAKSLGYTRVRNYSGSWNEYSVLANVPPPVAAQV
ncbi:hypothetical protein BGW38_003071, partial [Lunasporangiospora selenospora]